MYWGDGWVGVRCVGRLIGLGLIFVCFSWMVVGSGGICWRFVVCGVWECWGWYFIFVVLFCCCVGVWLVWCGFGGYSVVYWLGSFVVCGVVGGDCCVFRLCVWIGLVVGYDWWWLVCIVWLVCVLMYLYWICWLLGVGYWYLVVICLVGY